MDRGKYHSRSPEEFREWLKSINQKHKAKKPVRNILILLNLLLILMVTYIAKNQITEKKVSKSEILLVDGIELYLSSQEKEKWFLFYSQKEQNAKPEIAVRLKFLSNETICKDETHKLVLDSALNQKKFLIFNISKTPESPDECKILEARSWTKFFSKESNSQKITLEVGEKRISVDL